jgi:putative ABC transport system permease protein
MALMLVWGALIRRKIRTLLTALSIAVAFLLFGLLMAIRAALSFGVESAGSDTLMMFQKVSFARPLPVSYQARIANVPGVAAVTHATWFGGVYQDQKQWFPQLAVDAETFLDMHTEYRLPPTERRDWLSDRTGSVVGRDVAARFGWRVGDRIPLRRADGSSWTFTIRGIYDAGRPGADLSQMFFHYAYLNESRTLARDTVGWYEVRVADPARAADVAARLDAEFENSGNQTKTATTKAFLQAWARQIGDIGTILITIVSLVLFTLLLVTTTTMSQSIRERTNELAVLKALGFTDGRVLGLVLQESLGLVGSAGSAGLVLAWLIVRRGDPTGGLLPAFYLPTSDLLIGVTLILTVGLVTATVPAWQASRLRIVDALRR